MKRFGWRIPFLLVGIFGTLILYVLKRKIASEPDTKVYMEVHTVPNFESHMDNENKENPDSTPPTNIGTKFNLSFTLFERYFPIVLIFQMYCITW